MFEEINKELEQLLQGVNRYNKIKAMIASLNTQVEEQEKKLQIYKNELEKENIDVEKLNKINITSLFYSILGSKDKQMEKERQELLAAQLKYEDINRQIEDTKYQISKLEAEKSELEYCEKEYKELYDKKYQILKNQTGSYADKISEIEKNILVMKSNMNEIEEAINAGQLVIDELNNTRKSLDSAEGWGTWDLLGGGLLSDIAKHSHIDEARESASEVQSLLNNFRTELTDVKVTSEININIEGFVKFADFFFDGLIADWVVQSHIRDSIESIENVRIEVNTVINKLQEMKSNDKDKLNKLECDLEDIIEHA